MSDGVRQRAEDWLAQHPVVVSGDGTNARELVRELLTIVADQSSVINTMIRKHRERVADLIRGRRDSDAWADQFRTERDRAEASLSDLQMAVKLARHEIAVFFDEAKEGPGSYEIRGPAPALQEAHQLLTEADARVSGNAYERVVRELDDAGVGDD